MENFLNKNIFIEERLGTIENLPTLPMVLRQVQKLMNNPNSNLSQIASVLAKDQALAFQAIRLANSAFYGLRSRITSVTQAVVVLGLDTLNGIMIGITVIKMFKNSKNIQFNQTEFWKHCLATALLSRELGIKLDYPDPEECFAAGLLHDMGRLIIEQYLNTLFVTALNDSIIKKIPLYETEKDIIGFTHSEAGTWLAIKWGIPEILTLPMLYHHCTHLLSDKYEKYRLLVNIISYSNELCGAKKIGNSGEYNYNIDSIPENLGITNEWVNQIGDKISQEVQKTLEEWDVSN